MRLAHLALSVDASKTGRSWEKREFADKGRPGQAWNTALCNKGYRKAGAVERWSQICRISLENNELQNLYFMTKLVHPTFSCS